VVPLFHSSRNLFAVTAATFVGFTGFTLVMPFLALYVRELGVTDTEDVALWTGATLGVTPAITAVCAPLWGRVGDRYGNKLLVQRSLLSGVVIVALMGHASAAWQLFALRAVQGFVAGYGPVAISMAALSVPPERMARAIGIVQTAQRVGPAIGPILGGVLAAAVGLRQTFFVAAVVYAIAFVMMTVLYRERHEGPREGRPAGRPTFGTILTLENFVLLMVVVFGLQLADKSFGPVLLLYLGELGYPAEAAAVAAGLLFSTLALAGALGNQLAARLLERSAARIVIAGAALTAAGALTVFAFSANAWLMLCTIALFGASIGTAMTTAFTAAGSVIPRHAHGASFGFLTSASLLGSALSPALSGLVAAQSIRAVFFSGVAVLGTLAFLVRHVMVERAAVIERAPAVDES
jgi:MFS family permease